jgi:hypothetical protein
MLEEMDSKELCQIVRQMIIERVGACRKEIAKVSAEEHSVQALYRLGPQSDPGAYLRLALGTPAPTPGAPKGLTATESLQDWIGQLTLVFIELVKQISGRRTKLTKKDEDDIANVLRNMIMHPKPDASALLARLSPSVVMDVAALLNQVVAGVKFDDDGTTTLKKHVAQSQSRFLAMVKGFSDVSRDVLNTQAERLSKMNVQTLRSQRSFFVQLLNLVSQVRSDLLQKLQRSCRPYLRARHDTSRSKRAAGAVDRDGGCSRLEEDLRVADNLLNLLADDVRHLSTMDHRFQDVLEKFEKTRSTQQLELDALIQESLADLDWLQR